MTFKEAKEKLKELAGDKYFGLTYEYNEHNSGNREEQCGVYVNSYGWKMSTTFEDALKKMEMAMTVTMSILEEQQPLGTDMINKPMEGGDTL